MYAFYEFMSISLLRENREIVTNSHNVMLPNQV